MGNAHGCDVSKYEVPINFKLGRERGLSFMATRATVGDYYTDATLRDNWNGYKAEGFPVTAYLVTAPRDSTHSRQISAQAHLDRFFNSVAGLVPNMPWIVDAELERSETRTYITQLQKDVVIGLFNATGRYPIIYTRQTWWDNWVLADPLWSKCPLWAARYASWLTSPWSDGYCKFRDWTEWLLWQYTAKANGPYYGWTCLEGDLDWFNGDVDALYQYANMPRPLTIEEKVEILWREAGARGWNLSR